MRLSHVPNKIRAIFDDQHVIAHAGLVPIMRLAQRCGLESLVTEHVRIDHRCGVNAGVKASAIVAGMTAGADSIDDLDVLRHGGMDKVFTGIRAPSTLGSHLRSYTWGNVRQLEKVGRAMLTRLAGQAPVLPGADVVAFVDVDSTQKRVYGYGKQGAGFGHTKIQGKSLLVKGLNPLIASIVTPQSAPVIAATRLRGGSANSARGAAWFVREAITAARSVAKGRLVLRGDSAFYSASVLNACRDNDVHFSVTTKTDPKIKTVIAGIDADAWTPIEYPQAIYDEQAGGWVSAAEIAEVPYTAFASKKNQAITARLIVRRVRRRDDQDALFPTYRYHPIFTDSPYELIQAEDQHRDHAIIEQVNADLYDGPLAHLPSGDFAANAAWLTLAAISYNLLRAYGTLAGTIHGRARGATLRRQLISVPARTARHGRGHLVLHLPEHWPWAPAWMNAFTATCGPPPARAA